MTFAVLTERWKEWQQKAKDLHLPQLARYMVWLLIHVHLVTNLVFMSQNQARVLWNYERKMNNEWLIRGNGLPIIKLCALRLPNSVLHQQEIRKNT
jgi:hypothetical protein